MNDQALFKKTYLKNLEIIASLMTEDMQIEISKHNSGWAPKKSDFYTYLKLSLTRYQKVYDDIVEKKVKDICDIGGFWGVFPITLSELGYNVSITEATEYYSDNFKRLFEFQKKRGVNIIEVNMFERCKIPDVSFDYITLLAVLEHYPHSPRAMFENIKNIIRPNGYLTIEVPNIAYLPNRIKLLSGISPLVNIATIDESLVPFIGHHHEYTMREILYLEKKYGFKHLKDKCFNYSNSELTFFQKLKHPLEHAIYFLFKNSREEIMSFSQFSPK